MRRFAENLTMPHDPATEAAPANSAAAQAERRRTFAIISHPDAGKTTLTEKFLLYGGAVQLAGSVTARKNQRACQVCRTGFKRRIRLHRQTYRGTGGP